MSDLGDAFTRMPPEQQHKKGLEALKRANGRGTEQDDRDRQLLMLLQMQESMGISDAVPRTQELPVRQQQPFDWAPLSPRKRSDFERESPSPYQSLPELPITYPGPSWPRKTQLG